MCVCVCVCMCVCVCAYVHVSVWLCVCKREQVVRDKMVTRRGQIKRGGEYFCLLPMFRASDMCDMAHLHVWRTHRRRHWYRQTYTYTYMLMHVCTCIHMCPYTHTHNSGRCQGAGREDMSTYTYTYTHHIWMRAYMRTNTSMYKPKHICKQT